MNLTIIEISVFSLQEKYFYLVSFNEKKTFYFYDLT